VPHAHEFLHFVERAFHVLADLLIEFEHRGIAATLDRGAVHLRGLTGEFSFTDFHHQQPVNSALAALHRRRRSSCRCGRCRRGRGWLCLRRIVELGAKESGDGEDDGEC
jgi:hypothetical protein